MIIWFSICHFLLVVLRNQASNSFWDLHPRSSGIRPWPFKVTWRQWACDHLIHQVPFQGSVKSGLQAKSGHELHQSGPWHLICFNIKFDPCAPAKGTKRWAIVFMSSRDSVAHWYLMPIGSLTLVDADWLPYTWPETGTAYKFGKMKFPEFSRFSRPSKQLFPDN